MSNNVVDIATLRASGSEEVLRCIMTIARGVGDLAQLVTLHSSYLELLQQDIAATATSTRSIETKALAALQRIETGQAAILERLTHLETGARG